MQVLLCMKEKFTPILSTRKIHIAVSGASRSLFKVSIPKRVKPRFTRRVGSFWQEGITGSMQIILECNQKLRDGVLSPDEQRRLQAALQKLVFRLSHLE